MLKITTETEEKTIRFVVEGKLIAASIGVLERCWREAKHHPEIQIEFKDITYIDESAKKLLIRMSTDGVKFFANDVQMKAVIEKIQTNYPQKSRRKIIHSRLISLVYLF
jgi:hypothetical protein